MREFEHKRKVRKFLSSPLVLIPLGVLLAFLARGTWNIYLKNRDSGAELRSAENRLLRVKEREAQISSATAKLQTESGIEAEIRDRFQMAKDGERAIVIVDTPDHSAAPSSSAPNFLQKIWDFFTIR